MEVEDHPIEYNTFEGTIPAGEYGGGTVMLWDRGTYEADSGNVDDLRRGHERGDMKITLHGERLEGSFALVRMRGKDDRKPQWAPDQASGRARRRCLGHRDNRHLGSHRTDDGRDRGRKPRVEEHAGAQGGGEDGTEDGFEPCAEQTRYPEPVTRLPALFPPPVSRLLKSIAPMLATIGTDVPRGEGWTFEPK
jgi:bifunctional non-homologous end joining protein LigD